MIEDLFNSFSTIFKTLSVSQRAEYPTLVADLTHADYQRRPSWADVIARLEALQGSGR